ncbi:hypothetical protein AC626_15610 [Pseudoalteromonas rubra]|uniref:Uncharacterized protein n=1 Tax=Pseudoalteromonas rubra TaxID=43658 RepID=A0A0L0EQL0_9GAMM|nr:hypothetical protein AC626_15610 [Pseudoalteromonas rubra]
MFLNGCKIAGMQESMNTSPQRKKPMKLEARNIIIQEFVSEGWCEEALCGNIQNICAHHPDTDFSQIQGL